LVDKAVKSSSSLGYTQLQAFEFNANRTSTFPVNTIDDFLKQEVYQYTTHPYTEGKVSGVGQHRVHMIAPLLVRGTADLSLSFSVAIPSSASRIIPRDGMLAPVGTCRHHLSMRFLQ
jgi:hypothetical protein